VQDAGQQCQRTLEVRSSAGRVAPGAPVRVTVTGYDDSGRGVRVPGATVRLGSSVSTTDGDGVAVVSAPASGVGRLVAERDRMVRSFPRRVVVG
jgi:hypothetical protein